MLLSTVFKLCRAGQCYWMLPLYCRSLPSNITKGYME